MSSSSLLAIAALGFLAFSSGTGEARALAIKVAADVQRRKYDYSRKLLRDFQRAAGFTGRDVDGIYGPRTVSAVAKYTSAPKALFKGSASS